MKKITLMSIMGILMSTASFAAPTPEDKCSPGASAESSNLPHQSTMNKLGQPDVSTFYNPAAPAGQASTGDVQVPPAPQAPVPGSN